MTRFLEWAAWLCTSLGIALLVCSVTLVPQGQVFADDGGSGALQLSCVQELCPPMPPPNSCRVFFPPNCSIAGTPCTTQPPGVCDGCSCQWDNIQMNCICKLVGT